MFSDEEVALLQPTRDHRGPRTVWVFDKVSGEALSDCGSRSDATLDGWTEHGALILTISHQHVVTWDPATGAFHRWLELAPPVRRQGAPLPPGRAARLVGRSAEPGEVQGEVGDQPHLLRQHVEDLGPAPGPGRLGQLEIRRDGREVADVVVRRPSSGGVRWSTAVRR